MKADLKSLQTRLVCCLGGSFLANLSTKRAPGRGPALALARLLLAATLALPALKGFATGGLTVLHTFSGDSSFGWGPNMPGLIQGADGYLYGADATVDPGLVYKISLNGDFKLLHSFTGGSDGSEPHGALVQASDGYFYGTTYAGGTNGYGTVFQVDANGGFETLYSFNDFRGDPENPMGALVQGSDGWLYGTTFDGGTNYCGTVFKISTGGTLINLYSFTNALDGANPFAGVVQGRDGYFYGTASAGGAYSNGTVFKISSTGIFTNLHSFRGGSDGAMPCGGLLQASDGNIYGTTSGQNANGTLGSGTVFKISTNGSVTTVASCAALGAGASPQAGLAEGSDGRFYGTVYGVGSLSPTICGGVFSMGAGGDFISIYKFTNGVDGAYPEAALVQASDGYFYGLANYGGPYDKVNNTYPTGTMFRLSPSGPPSIFIQPVSISSSNGATAGFSVLALGSPPLAYQWQRNGTNLSDTLGVFGVASSGLALTVTAGDAGNYDVIVTNAYGSVTSLVVWLTVLGPNVALLPIPVTLYAPPPEGGYWSLGFSTAVGQSYTIQRNPNLWTTNWITYTNFIGDGLWRDFLFPPASPPSEFFRVLEPPN